MTKIYFGFVLLALLACGKSPDSQEENGLSAENNAQWIRDERGLPESDSLFYLDRPAPLSGRSLSPEKR